MKIIPLPGEIIGRVVIMKTPSKILRPDETRGTTKFVLVDAIGAGLEGVEINGLLIKPGSIVLPRMIHDIKADGGMKFWPLVKLENIAGVATEVADGDFAIQIDNGTEYVPFGDERAAKPLGKSFDPPKKSTNGVEATA